MEQLIYLLFMMCIKETIPNPHTINYLTSEQTQLIRKYAEEKCNQRVDFYLGKQENPMCEEYNTECM